MMTHKFLVCLAHFIVVVGGLTGDKGYAKLLAIELWARNLWQQVSE
jgi:heme oxygenase